MGRWKVATAGSRLGVVDGGQAGNLMMYYTMYVVGAVEVRSRRAGLTGLWTGLTDTARKAASTWSDMADGGRQLEKIKSSHLHHAADDPTRP